MMQTLMLYVGNFFFKWRDAAFSLVFMVAFVLLITSPEIRVGEIKTDIASTIIGLLFVIAGQTTRALTIGLAYIKRGGKNKKIYAEKLVQRGMFAHSRNPLYLGNLAIVTGTIITINISWYYLVALPLFYFIYLSITLAEENYLGSKFGKDYSRYMKKVNRFFPGNLREWEKSTRGMDFTWKRLLKKEHGSTFVIFSGLLICNILKFHYRYDVSYLSPFMLTLWALLSIFVIFQIILEFLKRSGRLEWDSNRP